VPIEESIKAELECVASQVMVIGDRRRHLAALITLKTILDPLGQPTPHLDPAVLLWLAERGSTATSAEEVAEEVGKVVEEVAEKGGSRVREALLEALHRSNAKAVSRAQYVHKVLVLPQDFSIAAGQLTPTLKVRRHQILQHYRDEIEKLYEDTPSSTVIGKTDGGTNSKSL